MDILIVGGARFLGTNFMQFVLDKYCNYNVVCIDSLDNFYHEQNIDYLNDSHFYFYHINTSVYSELLNLFKFWFSFDIVINFDVSDNNVMGIYNILEIIKKYKTKKYLQVSAETENIISDNIALSYCKQFKLPVVILKYSNNYGSFQHPREFISSLITNALEMKKLVVSEDLYSGVNIIDHCRVLETLMHYGVPGEIYYLGSDECIKGIEIGLFIVNYLEITSNLIEEVRDISRQKINTIYTGYDKLNKEFEWVPLIDFKSGLVDTIEWYKINETWWKNLI